MLLTRCDGSGKLDLILFPRDKLCLLGLVVKGDSDGLANFWYLLGPV